MSKSKNPRKKKEPKQLDVQKIKDELFEHLIASGGKFTDEWGKLNEKLMSKIQPSLDKLTTNMFVELPAFQISVKDLPEFNYLIENGAFDGSLTPKTDGLFKKAIEQAQKFTIDPQARYEYHEREMQRHADAAQKAKEELSQSLGG